MESTVTVIFKGNAQPETLYNVLYAEIRYGVITVRGAGYKKIYFKEDIKSITVDGNCKLSIR